MKITTFNPMILTKKPEEAIALFEALGFERHHHKSDNTENEEQGLAFLQGHREVQPFGHFLQRFGKIGFLETVQHNDGVGGDTRPHRFDTHEGRS